MYRADIEEKVVESAASIIHYMLRRNINTGLYTNGRKITYTRGRDLQESKRFMDELISIKSNGLIPVEEMLESRARLLMRGSSIVLITPVVNDKLVDKVVQLEQAGFDVILVFIMGEDINEEYKNIISSSGIRLYKVGLNDDVKESLEG